MEEMFSQPSRRSSLPQFRAAAKPSAKPQVSPEFRKALDFNKMPKSGMVCITFCFSGV